MYMMRMAKEEIIVMLEVIVTMIRTILIWTGLSTEKTVPIFFFHQINFKILKKKMNRINIITNHLIPIQKISQIQTQNTAIKESIYDFFFDLSCSWKY